MMPAALPQHVLVKLLALEEAVAALKAGADEVERGIEDRRARLWATPVAPTTSRRCSPRSWTG
jgi:hypothetical protein